MTQTGPDPAISPRMTVLDVVSRFRETEAVFKSYDAQAGACICCEALFEPIEEAARRFGLNLEGLMSDLDAAIQAPDGKDGGIKTR